MLSKDKIIQLTKKAHHLEPIVMIGQKGLTENVLNEISRALDDHHLIKIKARAEREEIAAWAEDISVSLEAEVIKIIGKIIILYRKPKEE